MALAKIREALRLDAHEEDDHLIALERAAVAVVERAARWYFGPLQETTEHVEGLGTRNLWLTQPPVVGEETPVSVEGVEADSYSVRGRRLVRDALWTLGREYEVSYWRGYPVTTPEGVETGPDDDVLAPDDVRKLVLDLVVWWFEERLPAGTTEGTSTELPPLPLHAEEILRSWRRRVWA